MSARVCIVTASSLSSGPRVEKEAAALQQAGFDVRVVGYHSLPWMAEWDARIAADHSLDFRPVAAYSTTARTRAWRTGAVLLQRTAAAVCARTGSLPVLSDLALSERVLALGVAARDQHADLFIAHNLPALPVAAALASQRGARLAFDSEDDHEGELPEGTDEARRTLIERIQERYLPRCAYVSVPSEQIADLIEARYGIARPVIVHNVFPWSQREQLDGLRRDRQGQGLSLYWYSQTIGLDRGLQDALRAAALLRGDFELHLRGAVADDVRAALLAIAREGGIAERVFFHEQTTPQELLSRSAEHDIGLALEQPVSRNRLLTVTNKLFFYLLAGLAVAATDTPGQRTVTDQLPGASFSCLPGDHVALARGLQRWLDDPAELARARAAALEGARTRFCWEIEREHLIATVQRALA